MGNALKMLFAFFAFLVLAVNISALNIDEEKERFSKAMDDLRDYLYLTEGSYYSEPDVSVTDKLEDSYSNLLEAVEEGDPDKALELFNSFKQELLSVSSKYNLGWSEKDVMDLINSSILLEISFMKYKKKLVDKNRLVVDQNNVVPRDKNIIVVDENFDKNLDFNGVREDKNFGVDLNKEKNNFPKPIFPDNQVGDDKKQYMLLIIFFSGLIILFLGYVFYRLKFKSFALIFFVSIFFVLVAPEKLYATVQPPEISSPSLPSPCQDPDELKPKVCVKNEAECRVGNQAAVITEVKVIRTDDGSNAVISHYKRDEFIKFLNGQPYDKTKIGCPFKDQSGTEMIEVPGDKLEFYEIVKVKNTGNSVFDNAVIKSTEGGKCSATGLNLSAAGQPGSEQEFIVECSYPKSNHAYPTVIEVMPHFGPNNQIYTDVANLRIKIKDEGQTAAKVAMYLPSRLELDTVKSGGSGPYEIGQKIYYNAYYMAIGTSGPVYPDIGYSIGDKGINVIANYERRNYIPSYNKKEYDTYGSGWDISQYPGFYNEDPENVIKFPNPNPPPNPAWKWWNAERFIIPVVPGLWEITEGHNTAYNFDGTDYSDYVVDSKKYWPLLSKTILVKGPDAYLKSVYPEVFFSAVEPLETRVKTVLHLSTQYSSESFNNQFPLLTKLVFCLNPANCPLQKTYVLTDSSDSRITPAGEIPAGQSDYTVTIEDKFPTESLLGVTQVRAYLKFDPNGTPQIPANQFQIMKEGIPGTVDSPFLKGYGSTSSPSLKYAYDYRLILVNYPKIINSTDCFLPEAGSLTPYFCYDSTEKKFILILSEGEQYDIKLVLQNPFLEEKEVSLNTETELLSPEGIQIQYYEDDDLNPSTPPVRLDPPIPVNVILPPATLNPNLVPGEKKQYSVRVIAPDIVNTGSLEDCFFGVITIPCLEKEFKIIADNSGVEDNIFINLKVLHQKSSPIADFTAVPVEGVTPLLVIFDASNSEDFDGQIVSYAWDFGDGETANGKFLEHLYSFVPESGYFTVKLTVTDDDGLTGFIEKNVKPFDEVNLKELFVQAKGTNNFLKASVSCTKNGLNVVVSVWKTNGAGDFVEKIGQKSVVCNDPNYSDITLISDPGTYIVKAVFAEQIKCNRCEIRRFIAINPNLGFNVPDNSFVSTILVLFFVLFLLKK